MSLDQRVRDGLDRMSAGVEPQVHERFGAATRSAARARRRRQFAVALTLAAALVAGVVALPSVLDVVRVDRPGAGRTGVGSPWPIPAGSYVVRVARADALAAGVEPSRVEGFAGRYVFTFAPDGSYVWEEATPNPFIKDGGGGVTTRVGDLVTFPGWLHGGLGERVTVRVASTSPTLRFAVVGASPPGLAPFAQALFSSKPWTPTG
jgi:hypothetical protein